MSRKRFEDLSATRQKELKKQHRNPPTPQYRRLHALWYVLLGIALVRALFASPLSSFGSEYSLVFVGAGNILVVVAIILETMKLRVMRIAYIEDVINSNSKQQRREEKRARAAAKETCEFVAPTLEEQLDDPSVSFSEKLLIRARLSAQAAQVDLRRVRAEEVK